MIYDLRSLAYGKLSLIKRILLICVIGIDIHQQLFHYDLHTATISVTEGRTIV
jgi:hypothetical protein